MRITSKKILGLAVAVPLVGALLGGCTTATDSAKGSEGNPVKIGVVGESDAQWIAFEDAAKAEGIYVDIVGFTDYTQPNPALAEGELDLNEFQHVIYLAKYNESANGDLTPIGSTAIYPLGLYSKKHSSVDDIPEGSTILVPNDDTNRARALGVLQSAGLITLTDGGTPTSTLDDIDEGASKVKVTEVSADQTANGLDDVAGSVINNDYVKNAFPDGGDPIAKDDPSAATAQPYINIFVSRAEDKDNETYLKLVKIFQDNAEVQQGLQESSGNTAIPVVESASDLQDLLKTTTEALKASA
ncbi:MetQ/NlpA family ABC transporter substrate-binding protein [Pseudoclavibacter soli]|uniref:MetQ/NlpA family ABC transporter substrate-binding protein n=1 Tax=Pseudoclavibacter soli TaxID=452623 RepID=UPI000405B0C2|nr:MetQ/NlpA family ABC transporter substrate-binding protein [Pseudoclavibacter soli]